MKIGVVKEVKDNENRVSVVPAGVKELVKRGHTVYVQHTAGENSGFPDQEYIDYGAKILPTIADVYAIADMIVKHSREFHPTSNGANLAQQLFRG